MKSKPTIESIKISHANLNNMTEGFYNLNNKDVLCYSEVKRKQGREEKPESYLYSPKVLTPGCKFSKYEHSETKSSYIKVTLTPHLTSKHIINNNINNIEVSPLMNINLTSLNEIEKRAKYHDKKEYNSRISSSMRKSFVSNANIATLVHNQLLFDERIKNFSILNDDEVHPCRSHANTQLEKDDDRHAICHVFNIYTNIDQEILLVVNTKCTTVDVSMEEFIEESESKSNSGHSDQSSPIKRTYMPASSNILISVEDSTECLLNDHNDAYEKNQQQYVKDSKICNKKQDRNIFGYSILHQDHQHNALESSVQEEISLADNNCHDKKLLDGSLSECSIAVECQVSKLRIGNTKSTVNKIMTRFYCNQVVNFDEGDSHVDFTTKNFEVANICSIDDLANDIDHNNIKTLYNKIKESVYKNEIEQDDGFSFYRLGVSRGLVFCKLNRHEGRRTNY